MDILELFEILDIESADDFKYFDNRAALLESEENISYEAIHELLSAVEPDTTAELITDYFTDIMEGVPEAEQ